MHHVIIIIIIDILLIIIEAISRGVIRTSIIVIDLSH